MDNNTVIPDAYCPIGYTCQPIIISNHSTEIPSKVPGFACTYPFEAYGDGEKFSCHHYCGPSTDINFLEEEESTFYYESFPDAYVFSLTISPTIVILFIFSAAVILVNYLAVLAVHFKNRANHRQTLCNVLLGVWFIIGGGFILIFGGFGLLVREAGNTYDGDYAVATCIADLDVQQDYFRLVKFSTAYTVSYCAFAVFYAISLSIIVAFFVYYRTYQRSKRVVVEEEQL